MKPKNNINEIEKRIHNKNKIELREEEDGNKTITGYALKWEELSEPLGIWFTFREKFSKGSFEEYLNNSDNDIKALMNHEQDKVLGRRKNNTVKVFEDQIGLHYKVTLANTTLGNDLFESVKRQDIDGVSVGFRFSVEEWDESNEKNIVRTIKKAELIEFSFTAWPAYTSTTTNIDNRNNDPYRNFISNTKKDKINWLIRCNKINSFKKFSKNMEGTK